MRWIFFWWLCFQKLCPMALAKFSFEFYLLVIYQLPFGVFLMAFKLFYGSKIIKMKKTLLQWFCIETLCHVAFFKVGFEFYFLKNFQIPFEWFLMNILILLIDKNHSFEVEVEPPVEGKPSTPITQFPRWQCFYLTFVVVFAPIECMSCCIVNGCFLRRETMPFPFYMWHGKLGGME